jgi:hypothetical protein
VKIEDAPLVAMLEGIAFDELDRQFGAGEFDHGIAYESSGYFDPVSGEVQGIPDFSKVIAVLIDVLRDEGLMV